jgi:hypothetical protein
VYVLDKISGCGDSPWGPWITTYIALIHTAAATDLFFVLQRRRVDWGAMFLVLLLLMYRADEKRQSCKYLKIMSPSSQK